MKISEDDIGKALTYLAESAKVWSEARGLRVFLEESLRTVKAGVMLESARTTVAEREADGYSSQAYKDHLKKLRDAVQNEELIKAYRIAAEARIEVWRTMESSRRAANVT